MSKLEDNLVNVINIVDLRHKNKSKNSLN